MKKYLIVILCLFLLCGCKKEEEVKTVIKNEYEKYNSEYYKVEIDDDSIVNKVDADKINSILKSGSGVIFIGNVRDNVTRYALSIFLQVASGTSLDNLYYIDSIDGIDREVKYGEVLFVHDGNVVSSHVGTIDDKLDLSDEELMELYNIYSDGIHEVLGDTCDERC